MHDPSYHRHPNWPMVLVASDGTPIVPPGLVAVWCVTPGCEYRGGVLVSITGQTWDVAHCDHLRPRAERRMVRMLAMHFRGQSEHRITRRTDHGKFMVSEAVWQDGE